MDQEIDKKIILDYRTVKLSEYGEDVRALGCGSVESQEERMKIIAEMADFNNKSILDVGCGFGDLYSYLKKLGVHLSKYVGVDIHPNIIAIARKRLPELKFEVGDIAKIELEDKFDFVVASGIFGLETPHWQDVFEIQMRKMYDLCEIGIAVNFLSYYTIWEKQAHSHFARPEEILEFVLNNLSNQVVVRHDYRPNDFTIYVYRRKVGT